MKTPIKVSHILVKHEYEALDILKLLEVKNSLNTFESLAKKFSLCASSLNGGSLGEVFTERLDEDFAESLIKLGRDQISKPVKTRFGFHLIRRES